MLNTSTINGTYVMFAGVSRDIIQHVYDFSRYSVLYEPVFLTIRTTRKKDLFSNY